MSVTNTVQFDSLVRAIDTDGTNMLVGQRDGTISVVDASGSKRDVMKSHSDGEVWGLAKDAAGTIYTSGDDNKVMTWNPDTRTSCKIAKVTDRREKSKRGRASTLSKLPDSQCSRCVAVNDSFVAVAGNDGAVSIRAASDLDTEIQCFKDSTEWIEVMAFSPDNTMLAVGSHDNNIYVYNTSDWSLRGTCRGHNSYIMALDWCAHSKFLRSNCGAYELLFFAAEDCSQDPSGRSNLKDVEWASVTCKFLWQTQGIYPKGTDGTHVNSVCGSDDKQFLATGDDYGLVNLFNDPCIKGKPKCLRGHSEHVVRVMFGAGDARLFSIGGYDQTLMQWKKC